MVNSTTDSGLTIVYDAECPFCRNFVRLMALRKAVGSVALIDARTSNVTVQKLKELGYDLNEGMAAIYGNQIYHGSDAVILISSLTDARGWAGRLLAALLRKPRRAKFLYPYMLFGRRVTLRILGRPLIPDTQ